jgi:hypothetical protein
MEPAAPSLPIGAHLTTRRRGYAHHGLYAGEGRVIHYAGFKRFWQRGPVEEVTLEEFARGRGWEVKPWVAPKFAGQAAVERARSRLGESRYRLWTNNCEHFVVWSISGASESAQVEAWKRRLGLAPRGGRAAASA